MMSKLIQPVLMNINKNSGKIVDCSGVFRPIGHYELYYFISS